jgi:phage repressor protein C with HTH and peptisase S24 domain
MSEGKALEDAIKLSDMSATEVAEKIGISRNQLYQLMKKDVLTDDYKSRLQKAGIDITNVISGVKDDRVPYITNRESKLIPYYNIDVTAGAKELFLDSRETIDYNIDMPGFKDCDFAVPVSGHSMYPKISSGNIIFCKKVNHRQFIEYGHIYLIITDDRRMIKQIRKADDKEHLMLVSENPDYDTFDIKKELIQHLYLVKGWANKNEI